SSRCTLVCAAAWNDAAEASAPNRLATLLLQPAIFTRARRDGLGRRGRFGGLRYCRLNAEREQGGGDGNRNVPHTKLIPIRLSFGGLCASTAETQSQNAHHVHKTSRANRIRARSPGAQGTTRTR